MNEADTCRKYVVPRLQKAGWDNDPRVIAEQRSFTDGRIIPVMGGAHRRPPKRADYILNYTRDFPIAVVEAKPDYKHPGSGLTQAKEYAQYLGLKFAYSTNGEGIVEFDFITGRETTIKEFPTPEVLWKRLRSDDAHVTDSAMSHLLEPDYYNPKEIIRYYQRNGINAALHAILGGQKRVLLTMATGTGKTTVAFQICWKLWKTKWTARGENKHPRILFLADRNFLVDDPKAKRFAPFEHAREKVSGNVVLSREMYFATYQAIAQDERRPGLFKEFPRDFFDLIIIDECHRGSAKDESNWHEILEWFSSAYQLGMPATPKHEDNADTYLYFGNPVYTYSLKQGIEDGFLAPYRVHRVITTWDAAGWRPDKGTLDRYGRNIPDKEYHTPEFHREIELRAHTEAVARHLTDFMLRTDRFAKTIVFCADIDHATEMRMALTTLNADLVKLFPDYVCRVTSDDKEIGKGHMEDFQDVEKRSPVILTTSQLLSTGLDAPTCTNIVLARTVNSITEFKQIIGRGTRVRDDYNKLWFNILDYTGSATRNFADPDFDGDPAFATQEQIDKHGNITSEQVETIEPVKVDAKLFARDSANSADPWTLTPDPEKRKLYFDGGYVDIATHLVYELDADGNQLRVHTVTQYAADKVRSMFPTARELRSHWANPEQRAEIISRLKDRGIDFVELAAQAGMPEADPFDLLCHVAFNAPLRTRRERAERLKREQPDILTAYSPEARAILDDLLEKYAQFGDAQFTLPDILKVPPVSRFGSINEIAALFGGAEELRAAVNHLQVMLYEG